MIRLRPVCPAFETPEGALVHPAEAVAIEVMGEAATLHADMVKEAAAAVLHYFEYDLGRNTVSVSEFSAALKKALDGLGLEVDVAPTPAVPAEETDLQALLAEAPNGLELVFFPRLRTELRRKLEQGPGLLRFCGLRGCVKQMLGARRWSHRCQALHDHIVEFMRTCLDADRVAASCALVVR
jgi:hypothetical protein